LLALVVVLALTNPAMASSPGTPSVEEAEGLLSDLGYWTGSVDATFDAASRHALVAFQKVEGRERTGKLTAEELDALRAASRPVAREGGEAHVEVDLTRQVLFLVDGRGVVKRVVPISSGSGKPYFENGRRGIAETPRGRFVVERKLEGWRKSPLGRLYYPSYFHKGWAVHGAEAVPTRPASHGCIRVPMYAARELSGMMPVGMPVIIFE
jgi:lipoprotein-anchoring transpeptidase ErfK/SrfK